MSLDLPPNALTVYLDRNFGSKIAVEILRAKGISCEVHDRHLSPNAPDEDWVELCSKKGWIAVTKDTRLRKNPIIVQTIKASDAGIFVFKVKGLKMKEQAELLAEFYPKIVRYYLDAKRPFLASISQQGTIGELTVK